MSEVRDVSKFYNKKGRLTAYALACGYYENNSNGVPGGWTKILYKKHSVYMVYRDGTSYAFGTLIAARECYDRKEK